MCAAVHSLIASAVSSLTSASGASCNVAGPMYRAVSTEHNCNVYTMTALRLASSSLYCKPESFTLYAGSNKVLDYARALRRRIDDLNGLWQRQINPLTGAGDGAAIQTALQWDGDAVRHQFPGDGMRALLTTYATTPHERDQLGALEKILVEVLARIQTGAVPVPVPVVAAPPVVAGANLAQIVPAPIAAPLAGAPVAWAAPVNPLDAVRVFGRRIRDRMVVIEGAYAGLTEAVVRQNP